MKQERQFFDTEDKLGLWDEDRPIEQYNLDMMICTFDIAVWVERKGVFEEEQWYSINQMPLILTKSG